MCVESKIFVQSITSIKRRQAVGRGHVSRKARTQNGVHVLGCHSCRAHGEHGHCVCGDGGGGSRRRVRRGRGSQRSHKTGEVHGPSNKMSTRGF